MKRAKTAAVHLDLLIDLKHLALRYYEPMPAPLTLMPPSGTQLAAQQTAAAVLPPVGAPSGTQLDAQQTATAVLPPVGWSSSAASSSTLRRVINVPMDCARYDTEGMCFTGPMQVQWIGQLLQRPHQFVLHADGKHKLHHGLPPYTGRRDMQCGMPNSTAYLYACSIKRRPARRAKLPLHGAQGHAVYSKPNSK